MQTATEKTSRTGRPRGVHNRRPDAASPIFEGLITLEQFAEEAGRSIRTVANWHRDAGLPVIERGGLRLISREAARRWLLRGATGKRPNAKRR